VFTTPGTRTLFASYGGDGNFSGSISASVAQSVNNSSSNLVIAPSQLNFGAVQPGTVKTKKLMLFNAGTLPIRISLVETTAVGGKGTDKNFSAQNFCPSLLAAGKSCLVLVSFKPNNNDPRSVSGFLEITDNAAGSPQRVPLTALVKSTTNR
jgi:hypothetical protein